MRFTREFHINRKGLFHINHTYYYIVVIIVAGKKMQEREMKYTFNEQKLPNEESHPVTDPLGENSRNPAKNREKSVLKHNQIQK